LEDTGHLGAAAAGVAAAATEVASSSSLTARLGGMSIGEGAWRLVPLAPNQCTNFFVPFLGKDLGAGVWRCLHDAAKSDGVELKVRGNKSTGRHKQARGSLSIYGTSSSAVEYHLGQVVDAAAGAGFDLRTVQFPEQWVHMRNRALP
jgi:hypothetical protein